MEEQESAFTLWKDLFKQTGNHETAALLLLIEIYAECHMEHMNALDRLTKALENKKEENPIQTLKIDPKSGKLTVEKEFGPPEITDLPTKKTKK